MKTKRVLINKASKETLTQFTYCIVNYNKLKKEIRSFLSINESLIIHDKFHSNVVNNVYFSIEEMINNGVLKELSMKHKFYAGQLLDEMCLLAENKLPKNNKIPFNEFTDEIYNSIIEVINDTFFDAIEIINEIKLMKQ